MNKITEKMSTSIEDEGEKYDRVIDQQVYKYYVSKKIRLVRNWLDKKKLVLDVGCGTGAYTIPLAKQSEIVVGLDTSLAMIKRGFSKARCLGMDNICFVAGDVSHIPFRDNTYDLVFSVNLFHHVAVEDSIIAGLLEKTRCTKRGGHVIVFELNPDSLGWSNNFIPLIVRSCVYFLTSPFRQNVIDHDEKQTKIPNITGLLAGIPKAKVCLRKFGGFIPPYCPGFLFKSFILMERILEALPILKMFGAHTFAVVEVQ